jgi:hypothetical protein
MRRARTVAARAVPGASWALGLAAVASAALARAASCGGRCERCRRRPPTTVHHLDEVGRGGVELAALDRLLAVCSDCHRELHAD